VRVCGARKKKAKVRLHQIATVAATHPSAAYVAPLSRLGVGARREDRVEPAAVAMRAQHQAQHPHHLEQNREREREREHARATLGQEQSAACEDLAAQAVGSGGGPKQPLVDRGLVQLPVPAPVAQGVGPWRAAAPRQAAEAGDQRRRRRKPRSRRRRRRRVGRRVGTALRESGGRQRAGRTSRLARGEPEQGRVRQEAPQRLHHGANATCTCKDMQQKRVARAAFPALFLRGVPARCASETCKTTRRFSACGRPFNSSVTCTARSFILVSPARRGVLF
jgi:hypothetical protein